MDTWVWGFYHTPGVTHAGVGRAGRRFPSPTQTWTNVNGASLHNLIDLGDDMPTSLQKPDRAGPERRLLPEASPQRRRHDSVPQRGTCQPGLPDAGRRARDHDEQGALPRAPAAAVSLQRRCAADVSRARRRQRQRIRREQRRLLLARRRCSWAILDYIKDLFEYLNDLVLWLGVAGDVPAHLPDSLRALPDATRRCMRSTGSIAGRSPERFRLPGPRSALQSARAAVHQPG